MLPSCTLFTFSLSPAAPDSRDSLADTKYLII